MDWTTSSVFRLKYEESKHEVTTVKYGKFSPDSSLDYKEDCCIVPDSLDQFSQQQRTLEESLGDLVLPVKHLNYGCSPFEVVTPEFHYDMESLIVALKKEFDDEQKESLGDGKSPNQTKEEEEEEEKKKWHAFVEKRIQPVVSCIVEALRKLNLRGKQHGNIMDSIVVTDKNAINMKNIKIVQRLYSKSSSSSGDLDDLLCLILGILRDQPYPFEDRSFIEQKLVGLNNISLKFKHFLELLFKIRYLHLDSDTAKMWLYHPYVMNERLATNFMLDGHSLIFKEPGMYLPSGDLYKAIEKKMRKSTYTTDDYKWKQKMNDSGDDVLKYMVNKEKTRQTIPDYGTHWFNGWRFWRNVVQHYNENARIENEIQKEKARKQNAERQNRARIEGVRFENVLADVIPNNLSIDEIAAKMREHFSFEVMAVEIVNELKHINRPDWENRFKDDVFDHSLREEA